MAFGFIGDSPEQSFNSNKGRFTIDEIDELVGNRDWAGSAGLTVDIHCIGGGASGRYDAYGSGAGGGLAGGQFTFYKDASIVVGAGGQGSAAPGSDSRVIFNDAEHVLIGSGGGRTSQFNHFGQSNGTQSSGGNVNLRGANGVNGSGNSGPSGLTDGNFGSAGAGGGAAQNNSNPGPGSGNGLAGNGGDGANQAANDANRANAGQAGQVPGGGGGGGSGYYGAPGAGAAGAVYFIYTSEYQKLSGGTVTSSGSGANTEWKHEFLTSGNLTWL